MLTPIAYERNVMHRVARLAKRPGFVLLDSCHDRCPGGRYDVLATDPVITVTTHGATTTIVRPGQQETSCADPFEILNELLAGRHCVGQAPPFVGGAIGYFSYDLARRLERLPATAVADIDIPEMHVGIYDWAICVDHETRRAWLCSTAQCHADVDEILLAWNAQTAVTPAAFPTSFLVTSAVHRDMSFAAYATGFGKIKQYITDGDCYQVNFAQRFSATVKGDPWDAYQHLRNVNPAPYSAYVPLPDGSAVLSSSPERFLSVANGIVETKPIKGTRSRADDPVRDRALAAELAASEKDRAENLMIVDLLRNDLGRSAEIGSVNVPHLFEIESFARVHHLVSTVRARLRRGENALHALRKCFPGGSITGAPKIRAMEIIEELEPCRRSVYCGAVGYLSDCGNMDTNIAIRTLLHHRGSMYCWAGGGIVMDSELQAEYQESLDKAAAMLEVFSRAEAERVGR